METLYVILIFGVIFFFIWRDKKIKRKKEEKIREDEEMVIKELIEKSKRDMYYRNHPAPSNFRSC